MQTPTALPSRPLLLSTPTPDSSTQRNTVIRPKTTVCVMSGGEEKGSKRARKNYTSEVSRCTETVTCAGLEDAIEPQHLDELGEKLGEGSSVKQMAEEEFGELTSLLGEPHDCIDTQTDASVALLEQAESDPENIRAKLLELAVQLAGECHHSAPLKRWDPKDPKANTTCGKLQAQVVVDVDIEVRRVVLAQQTLYQCRAVPLDRVFVCPLFDLIQTKEKILQRHSLPNSVRQLRLYITML